MYGQHQQQHHAHLYNQQGYNQYALHQQVPYGQQSYDYSQYDHNQSGQQPYRHQYHKQYGQPPTNWYNPGHPTKRHKGNPTLITYPPPPSPGYASQGSSHSYPTQTGYPPLQHSPVLYHPPVPQPHVFHPAAPPWIPTPPTPVWNGHQPPAHHQQQGYADHRRPSSSHAVGPPSVPPHFHPQSSYQHWNQPTPPPWTPYGPPLPPAHHPIASHHQSTSPPASINALSASASASSGYAPPSRSQRSRNNSTAPTSEKPQSPPDDCDDMAWLDYEGNDYYTNEYDQIDPNLSLGTIIWRAPEPVSKVMPALYKYADAWFADPPPRPKKDCKDGVSQYITVTNVAEHCAPAYMCEDWNHMKNDPIFKVLDPESRLIPLRDVMTGNFELPTRSAGMHFDSILDNDEPVRSIERAEPTTKYLGALNANMVRTSFRKAVTSDGKPFKMDESEPMELEDDEDEVYSPPPILSTIIPKKAADKARESNISLPPPPAQPRKWNGVDERVRILRQPSLRASPIPDLGPPQGGRYERHSRTRSRSPVKLDPIFEHGPSKRPEIVVAPAGRDIAPKAPPQFARNDEQEDILARLGVTGAPKPAYTTPGPAYMPRRGSVASDDPSSGRSPANDAMSPPPIPAFSTRLPSPQPLSPPKAESTDYQGIFDPWSASYRNERLGTPHSVASQHTIAGSEYLESDFGITENFLHSKDTVDEERTPTKNTSLQAHSTDDDVTPKASEQGSKRKRSRTNSEEPYEGIRRQKDDDMARLRKRVPKVAAAYGRRW